MWIRFIVAFLATSVGPAADAADNDLRRFYGTPSFAAAAKIQTALEVADGAARTRVLEALENAIQTDPQCVAAVFHRARLLAATGRVPEAVDAYARVAADGRRCRYVQSEYAAKSMIALGDIHVRLGDLDASNRWYSKAILSIQTPKLKAATYWKLLLNYDKQDRPFAATIAASRAYDFDEAVFDDDVISQLLQRSHKQDVARLLRFEQNVPKVTLRPNRQLVPVSADLDVGHKVFQMLPDPRGRYVVLLVEGSRSYYLVSTGDKPTARRIELEKQAGCGCLVDGTLYIVPFGRSRLLALDPETGETRRTFSLGSHSTYSVAVFPRYGFAYFTVTSAFPNGFIYQLNLDTGELVKTVLHGQTLVGGPRQQFLYSLLNNAATGQIQFVTLGGDKLRERSLTKPGWIDSTLFRGVVGTNGLIVSDVVDRVAGSGRQIVLSPDGNWLCVPGKDQWTSVSRPANLPRGFGLPIFSPHDFRKLVGYVTLNQGCLSAAFNPVTRQFAVVDAGAIRIGQLGAKDRGQTVPCKSGGACAWSGNGRYLLVADSQGVKIFSNPLQAAEEAYAATWHKVLTQPINRHGDTQWAVRRPQPLESLKTFRPSSQRAVVSRILARAAASTRTEGYVQWQYVEEYLSNAAALRRWHNLRQLLADEEGFFDPVELATQAAEKFPTALILFELAVVQAEQGNDRQAAEAYQRVIRDDGGRSYLTIDALLGLAKVLKRSNQTMEAAFCAAGAISMDPVNPDVFRSGTSYLIAAGFLDEVAQLKRNPKDVTQVAAGAERPAVAIPPLTNPAPGGQKKPAGLIYAQSVPSVVMVEAGDRVGTGFCIAKGFVLTSAALVARHDTIKVTPFVFARGRVTKLATMNGRVVVRWANKQTAILQVTGPPATLTPLPVARANAGAGAQVYVMGNPRTGEGLLEQSMSDGIVSLALRKRQDRSYVQHTAAVSKGTAGGPLLDDRGSVIGLCTGDEQLDGLGLAIPVSVIRGLLERQQPE